MFSRLLPVFAFLFAGCALFAQSALPSPVQEPSTQSLLDQIQQLQKRLTDMEERQRKTDAALAALLSSEGVADKTPPAAPPTSISAPRVNAYALTIHCEPRMDVPRSR